MAPTKGDLSTILAVIALSIIAYTIYIAVRRLYFSPLSGFPGPKIAAVTYWYEFYYDFWRGGKYIFEIEKMHQRYGPIVRLNPDELSIHDAEFYNKLYVTQSTRRTNAHDLFCKGIDFDESHLLTKDHNLHRRRRKPLEPFFSRMGVAKLQNTIADVALHLERRLEDFAGMGKVVRLDHAFAAFSGDIIRRICLDTKESGEDRFLDDPAFAPEWYDVIHMIVRSIPLFTGFPIIVRIVNYIPESVLLWAFPRGQMFNKFKMVARQHIRKVLQGEIDHSKPGTAHISVFRHVADSDMPEADRSELRLAREAQVLLGGGTASTARTVGFASYYILSNPDMHARLQHELKDTMADWPQRIPTWSELEKLPFLQAILKESLRLSYGVMHRLPRVSPDVPIQYGQYTIPIGVPVGMSAYLMHSDPSVYPEPRKFIPERWMKDVTPEMQKSYVPFSRGSRNCLGMNLAMAEMSLMLAVLYRPGAPRLELFETDESDVVQAHDFLIPLPKLDTKGVRALVL
ncbi:cytochrome P450 [Byssothecium circinans]|uniref:Cytochrome P450 n=1 Tax=Byssothecium circinans TaxID=147558 RepID=A0A6A5UGC7_9PLEO|nr:cytochrome P450 [Byssothecium circinans]